MLPLGVISFRSLKLIRFFFVAFGIGLNPLPKIYQKTFLITFYNFAIDSINRGK